MRPKLGSLPRLLTNSPERLRSAVEKALSKRNIPDSRILVNVGDAATTNDDIREFNRLDTEASRKQFILLVNKGREGWNCRYLFGVWSISRTKIERFSCFKLRCAAFAESEAQYTGHVYFSQDNMEILNAELGGEFPHQRR